MLTSLSGLELSAVYAVAGAHVQLVTRSLAFLQPDYGVEVRAQQI